MKKTLGLSLLLAFVLFLASSAYVAAQGKAKKKADNQLITIDMAELIQAEGKEAFYENYSSLETTLNVAKFEDDGNSCYILTTSENPFVPVGFSCVK